jgi:tetratricopeptide (TPR) repeat protein
VTAADDPTTEVGAAQTPTPTSEGPAEDLPDSVGRYVVLERIGAGGMGVVYRARDPELDRVVALKVVRPGAGGAEATARLVREAQAMAQLTHPNVVPVFDVGTWGSQVFVAMEFVVGDTLRGWLSTPRDWSDVLVTMRAAGQGLAAAHGAGLLHRDFKPDNVMVGDDGRVRVMDFGLARAEEAEPSDTMPRAESKQSGESLQTPLTHDGSVMGTPAYMAPEQHLGGVLDARADQFAFCVATFQALYGRRPFVGTYHELVDKKQRGEIDTPPTSAGVPRWIHRALVRGLRPRASDRWSDMPVLLLALDPARRRRRTVGGLAVGTLVVAAAIVAADSAGSYATARADCATVGSELDAVWNEKRRKQTREAFAAREAAFALPTFDRTAIWLDGYAKRWTELRTTSCQREGDGTADAALEDRRRLCLRHARDQLEVFVERLAEPSDKLVESAVVQATALPSLVRCEDDEVLRSAVEPPPDAVAAEVERVREEVARIDGEPPVTDADLEHAQALAQRARDTAYDPVVAEALVAVGSLQREKGDYEASAETYAEAFHLAFAAGHDPTALTAARMLVFDDAVHLGKFEDAKQWADHGRAVLARMGSAPRDEALLRTSIAAIYQEGGPFDKAETEYDKILTIYRQLYGEDHPLYANALNGLGDLYRRMDRLPEARRNLERSVEIYEAVYGKNHPELFTPIGNLSVVVRMQGDQETAEPLLKRTIEVAKVRFGPEHPNVGMAMGNYANLFYERGDYQRQYEIYQDVIANFEKSLGPDHPAYAMALDNAGGALVSLGRYDEARPLIARALDIRQRTLGENHREVARSLSAVGRLANLTGDHEKARASFERAKSILDAAVDPDHRGALRVRNGLAVALQGLGRTREANELWTEIIERCQRPGADPGLEVCTEAAQSLGETR